jgi:hypothetical protein
MTRTQLEELAKRLDAVEHAEREVSLGMDMDPLHTANHHYAETCKEAAVAIRELLTQEPVAWMHYYRKPGKGYSCADIGEHGPDPDDGFVHVSKEPLYAAPVPAVDLADEIYRFAGWLTMRDGVMPVGATSDAAPMAEAVQAYLDKIEAQAARAAPAHPAGEPTASEPLPPT